MRMKWIQIRVYAEEHARYADKAKAEGKTISEWFRSLGNKRIDVNTDITPEQAKAVIVNTKKDRPFVCNLKNNPLSK